MPQTSFRERRAAPKEVEENTQFCGCHIHLCALILAIVLIFGDLSLCMLVIASKNYWAFVSVGVNLIAAFCLLLGIILRKSVLFYPFFVFVAVAFIFNIASMTYVFIKNSIGEQPWNSTITSNGTVVNEKRIIYEITLASIMFIQLVFLVLAFIIAWYEFKYVKSVETKPPRAVTYDPHRVHRPCVVEDHVDVIEHHTVDNNYY